MTDHGKPRDENSEVEVGRILGDVGARSQPPREMFDDVRAAVEAEWRSVVEQRTSQRRRWLWPAAAGIAAAAVLVSLLLERTGSPPALVATVSRVTGAAEIRAGSGDWRVLASGASLHEGDELQTSGGSRLALELADGLSVRMDHDSRLALNDEQHATLGLGAVYVDSGLEGAAAHAPLEIRTAQGTVSHLGTQYEARLDPDRLVVSVREGRVSVEHGSDRIQGAAGERLIIGPAGMERTTIEARGGDWAWAGEIVPSYAIEGRSLQDFLAWAARETGRSIDYRSADMRDAAGRLVLHGSIDGLTPEQALEAVLATTELQVDVDSSLIRIEGRK